MTLSDNAVDGLFPLPALPRLRPVEPRWVTVEGQRRLWLRDPSELGDQMALVPEALVPLVAAMDGTRDHAALAGHFAVRTGTLLTASDVETVLYQLDEALILDSPRYTAAQRLAVESYRAQPHREPALARRSYPAEAEQLMGLFQQYSRDWHARPAGTSGPRALPVAAHVAPPPVTGTATGVLSPHIDYLRGGALYAGTWLEALGAIARAEVVVIFGTDHTGGPGQLTLTRQRYATPWGAFPDDPALVSALGDVLGEARAFGEELHHRKEHSIELAGVWLHWALRTAGREHSMPPVVPILCGSFHCYTHVATGVDTGAQPVQRTAGPPGAGPTLETRPAAPRPEDEAHLAQAMVTLREAIGGRRAVVVAAADLAHVGPAFGDRLPLTAANKSALARADARLMDVAGRGDALAFLNELQREHDQRRVCGLPPIYWTMRLLEQLHGAPLAGRLIGYDQCPADDQNGSVVSIAGMVWE